MGPASLLLSLGAINGAVLAALIAAIRRNARANRCLALLIALVALRLGIYILGFAGAYDSHPWLSFLPIDLSFAFGPLLWLYVVTLTRGTPPSRWPAHLAPSVAQFLYYLACFALPATLKAQWYGGPHLEIVEPLATLVLLASCAAYLGLSWRRHRAYQCWLDDHFGNREQWRLAWLGVMLAAFTAALVLTIAIAAWSLLVTPLDYFGRLPVMLGFCALIYVLGLFGWRHGGTAYPPEPRFAPEAAPPATDYAALAAGWRERVAAAGWARDDGLTLAGLAQRLAVSERTLSRGLNDGAGRNFNAFVNGLRVAAVQRALRDGDARDLLTLALDSGFNSKASFNRAFKAETGQTPSAWRASQISPIDRTAGM